MSTNRRQFLTTAFGAVGVAAIGSSLSSLALANLTGGPDRYFVFCYFPGAWDVLMSMDPKVELLASNNVQDTRIEVDWDSPDTRRITTGTYGLSALPMTDPTETDAALAGRFVTNVYQPFVDTQVGASGNLLDRLTVVRGMSMDTLTHEVGRRRFLTGKSPTGLAARGNSISTVMAALLASTEPIPNLSAAVENYNHNQPAAASALNVSRVEDLLRALRPGDLAAAPEERDRVSQMLQSFRECLLVDRSANRRSALDARLGASALVSGGFDSAFDFRSNRQDIRDLRDLFGLSANAASNSVQARMAMAGQAITQGVSRVVSVQASRSCDTHFDNWADDQFDIQAEGVQGIAALAKHLDNHLDHDGVSFLEKTTIIAFSDFSRTPMFNGSHGRDHWLLGSCFLISPDLRPGVFGASSSEGMSPTPVDLLTGRPGTEIVKPEHVLATLFNTVGDFDHNTMPNDLRVDAYRALLRS